MHREVVDIESMKDGSKSRESYSPTVSFMNQVHTECCTDSQNSYVAHHGSIWFIIVYIFIMQHLTQYHVVCFHLLLQFASWTRDNHSAQTDQQDWLTAEYSFDNCHCRCQFHHFITCTGSYGYC